MILLVGANGSMGKRYQAILKSLGERFFPFDLDTIDIPPDSCFKAVIIASPTDMHSYHIKKFGHLGPVLCEKPVCKSLTELEDTLHYIRENNINFTMMNQYKLLDDPMSSGDTFFQV